MASHPRPSLDARRSGERGGEELERRRVSSKNKRAQQSSPPPFPDFHDLLSGDRRPTNDQQKARTLQITSLPPRPTRHSGEAPAPTPT